MLDLAGRTLGQYQLVDVIRRGGMSTIYKAYQPSLDRYVAVKVLLHPQDSQFILRFKREARAIAQLQHPNILTIYDFGEEDGLLFLVMQYIENGRTLHDLLQKPMDTVLALRIAIRVLEALEYAHSHGIIHRDLKPSNILMLSPIWPMLSDFGIAKLVNDKERLTMPGLLLGTPAYIAPEQAIGRAIDARTDLYSAGVVIFEMLTGDIPFDAPDPLTVLSKHAFEEPPSLLERNPSLSPELDRILKRALSKDPAERFQTATEMAAALERVVQHIEQSRLLSLHADFYLAGVQAVEKERWDLAVEHLSRVPESDPHYSTAVTLLRRALDELARRAAERQQQSDEPRPSPAAQPPVESLAPTALAEVQQPIEAPAAPPPVDSSGPLVVPEASPSSQSPLVVAPTPAPKSAAASTPRVPATAKLSDVAEQPAIDPPLEQQPTGDEESPADVPPAAQDQPAFSGAAVGRHKRLRGGVMVALAAVVALALGGSRMLELWPDQRVAAGRPVQSGGGSTVQPTLSVESRASSTQAPTAIPSPPPPRGTLIFEDDLSQGTTRSRLAEQISDSNFSRGVHAPGIYHFMLANPGDTRWQLLPGFAVGDFTLELDLWDNSDTFAGGVSQGVILRARDMQHFYAVLIDSRRGRYSVRQLNGENQWSDLLPWQESPLILRGDQVNRLRIDAAGNSFSVYINDRLLDRFTSDAYAFGMVGLLVANEDAVTPHIHFDNIKVWRSDAPGRSEQHDSLRQHPSGDMVLIPGGDFVVGSNERADEAPHIVTLSDFYIDRTEVTNSAYRECVEAGACTPQSSPSSVSHPAYANQPEFDGFPVLYVSWRQAEQFCAWAGKRLPTEAEWEMAASWNSHSQEKQVWPWGNQFDSSRANSLESGVIDTVAVDEYPEEVNHTLGMAGNVWEWTSSLYKPYPYNAGDGREDLQTSGSRVLRGGSWSQTQGKVQTTVRMFAAEDYNDREIGFRCAANP